MGSCPYEFKVTAPSLFLEHNLLVTNLIDESSASWKGEVVAGLFNDRDSELIFQIPLSFPLIEDRCV